MMFHYNIEFKERKTFLPESERKRMSRWKSSQVKSKWGDTRVHNELTNTAFMQLIRRVRKLYLGSNIEVYERDHRHDSALNATTMHVFITPDLYLELECSYVQYRCEVLYNLDTCLHANTVKAWLNEYPFSIAKREQTLDGGISAYFDRVKIFQDAKYFSTL